MTQSDFFIAENNSVTPKKSYLISRSLDALLMGGISILFYIITISLAHQKSIQLQCITVIFFLSFFVNFPHFILSYQLLYIDFNHLILKKFQFFWAAVIVPILILASFIITSCWDPQTLLGYFVNALYFFVGWHYIKQVFGIIIVTNALKKIFYTKFERVCLKANLYSLWGITWIWSNTNGSLKIYEGIIYSGLNFPTYWMLYCYYAVSITFFMVIFIHLKKYVIDGTNPTFSSITSFFSLYLWTIPLFYNPLFFYCLSFFHSLQYIPFVYAFRRNKINSEIIKKNKIYFIYHYGYFILSIILGAIAFYFLPRYIDHFKLFDFERFGPTVMMFYFTIFINIHHYFIDNVIWKKNNAEMKKYIY